MANFKPLFAVLLATGCASPQPLTPSGVVVAPAPKIYLCSDEKAVLVAYPSLPPAVQKLLDDYHSERVTLNALQGKKEAPACADIQ